MSPKVKNEKTKIFSIENVLCLLYFCFIKQIQAVVYRVAVKVTQHLHLEFFNYIFFLYR